MSYSGSTHRRLWTSRPGEASGAGGTKEKTDNAFYLLNYTVQSPVAEEEEEEEEGDIYTAAMASFNKPRTLWW